ncbi:MAG: PAS domain S-box protein [Nitrospira sp.]|nr:MAG: PAS domain S-box protein [Nitrospira sp.]
MKGVDSLAIRVAPWAIPVLTVGVLALDMFSPLGIAVWMLYAVPLLLTVCLPHPSAPLYVTAIMSLLVLARPFLSPAGLESPIAFFNRGLGLVLIWGLVWTVTSRKDIRASLAASLSDRRQAETAREAAVEARALSDTALLGAVTGRREAEDRLLSTKLNLDTVIQSAMDAIITVDDSQRVVLFNHAAEQMFGCAAQAAIGRPMDRFIPARFREAHRRHVAEFGRSGVTTRTMGAMGQVRGLRAGGEEFAVEAAISQVGVGGDKYLTVILRDISERKRLEEAQAHLASLVASSEDAIIGESLDGLVLSWNRAAEEVSGFSAQEVIGRPLGDFLPKEDAEKERNFLAMVARGDSIEQYETVRVRKDGQSLQVSLTISPIRNEQGRVIGASRIVRDMTEKKRLQEQLRRTERLAELGTLASGMAHEIGTPMNVILGRAEHLMQRTTDEQAKKGLQIIVTQVERITKIMNQLLTLARRRPSEQRPADLRRTIDDCVEVLVERFQKHRVHVIKHYEADPPPALVDPDQMSQVLLNLLLNADHAMAKGGTLRLGLRSDGDRIILTVSDTGHGIPNHQQSKIFTPFFTTKEAGKGTGLGLSVVHGIIEEHQGTISVESEVGKGTTFTITVPTAKA